MAGGGVIGAQRCPPGRPHRLSVTIADMDFLESCRRVVFERGIDLLKEEDGEFRIQSSLARPVAELTEVARRYKVRPVVALQEIEGEEMSLLLPTEGRLLDIRRSELSQQLRQKEIVLHGLNVSYAVGAVCYHCKRLAETCSAICKGYLRILTIQGFTKEKRTTYANQPEPYFEFEALVGAAIRAFEYARPLLWVAFGPEEPGLSTPRSFQKTIERCERLSRELRERLNQYFEGLKKYRDCIQHNVPIGRWLPYAAMEELADGVWSCWLPIPDNPESKSAKRFEFASRRDALTFGWEVTTQLMALIEMVLGGSGKKEQ